MDTSFLLFGAGCLAGMLNAVVGGGGFVAFPALLYAGLSPLSANMTMTVALFPGILSSLGAYRHTIFGTTRGHNPGYWRWLLIGSLLGGGLGALALMITPAPRFAAWTPYLLLLATLIFTFSPHLIRWATQGQTAAFQAMHFSPVWRYGMASSFVVITFYGGFFGAGAGILLLAWLTFFGMEEIHAMNAARTCITALYNALASLLFISTHGVIWSAALWMCLGSILGGYACAHLAQRLPRQTVRTSVVILAWAMTGFLFVHKP